MISENYIRPHMLALISLSLNIDMSDSGLLSYFFVTFYGGCQYHLFLLLFHSVSIACSVSMSQLCPVCEYFLSESRLGSQKQYGLLIHLHLHIFCSNLCFFSLHVFGHFWRGAFGPPVLQLKILQSLIWFLSFSANDAIFCFVYFLCIYLKPVFAVKGLFLLLFCFIIIRCYFSLRLYFSFFTAFFATLSS